MNQSYEVDKTCYLFAITKSGKNFWKKIQRPNKIILIINEAEGFFQFILDTAEDLSEFYTDDLYGFTFTLSNDPQQDPYGEMTNLGYSSIKIHCIAGQFSNPGTFSYVAKIKMIDEAKQIKSVMLRNNFPFRYPDNIMGANQPLFNLGDTYAVYKLSFFDALPNVLQVDKLSFKDPKIGAQFETRLHDMYNCANGSNTIYKNYVDMKDFQTELEKMLK